MTLEVLPSSSSYTDADQKNLKQLLEAFGSVVSLEDIASAYCQAGRNLCATGEILSNMQGSTTGTSTSKSQDDLESRASVSSGCPLDNLSENAHTAISKPKRSSASMGTVSGVIGKEYVTPRPQPNESREIYKPVKLNSDDFPVSEIWDEKKELESTSRSESMNHDIEEFIFKMLGNGFQLEMSVIKDMVGQCGYNMQMSVDKLLDMSAATLKKSNDVIGIPAGHTMENSLDMESTSSRGQSLLIDSSGGSDTDVNNREELILPQQERKKKDIQREVLDALFSVPDRIEEKQISTHRISQESRRSSYGRVVDKPLEETIIEDFTFITRQPVNNKNDEANENGYEDLRKAVTEYWSTMKEYYKAAVEAFAKKDHEKAQKLLEEGNFFMKKAREADEKSVQKIIEDSDEEEEFLLNMHCLEPKDAVRNLRLHLTSLSGFPSIRYLKVAVGTDGGDTQDRRRKRLITKLLENEGIPWTEEGNGWIISIQVDGIDPNKLSFANK